MNLVSSKIIYHITIECFAIKILVPRLPRYINYTVPTFTVSRVIKQLYFVRLFALLSTFQSIHYTPLQLT